MGSVATSTVRFSASRQLMRRQLSSLMLLSVRTRIWLMKSRTFWISLATVVAPSMSLTNSADVKRLTARFKRRKRNSTTPGRTTREPWTHWGLPWRVNSVHRAKRQTDADLADARNAINEMQVINSKAMHDKRNVESMIHTLQAEIDDMLGQAKNSEEKSKRAMVDAARLADELRAEQDHATAEDRGKRALDMQINELENRISDAEASAMKAGKAAMGKLEMRIRELEMELGTVQTQTQDSYKSYQR